MLCLLYTNLNTHRQGAISQALNALDFTSTRSQKDADLLYEAKYGKRGEDGKMTPQQYQ